MKGRVLLIDDEEQLRGLLSRIIRLEGFTVLEAGDLQAADKLLKREPVDVVLCDVKLPDGNGVDYIKEVKPKYPFTEIILLTAYGNIPDGIQAMKNGAFDYIIKGNDNDKIIPLLYKAIEKVGLLSQVEQLKKQVGKQYSFENIIGTSAAIKSTLSLAEKVAVTDATVLLLGETGTGKEVVAQAIHHKSKRANKPFVALNCSAFSKEILESELFGHKAGAFTGATKDKKGLLEEANNGTLFLDEIGEMHLDLQSKLLRVLETNEFFKVGDTKPTKVSVRVIAATNRDLQQEVEQGHFREDLFYRLNVFAITLPALRDRKEDIPALVAYFLELYARKANKRLTGVSGNFMEQLQKHNWKGNIRELKNVIERSVILAETYELTADLLPFDLQTAGSTQASGLDLATVEKLHIQKVMHYTGGNKAKAAEFLGIGLTTLYRKMEEYQIPK